MFFIVAIIIARAQQMTMETVINRTNFSEDTFPVGILNCTSLYFNNGIISHSQCDSFKQSQDACKEQKQNYSKRLEV